jgi:pilus assembly protein Flp/PilA
MLMYFMNYVSSKIKEEEGQGMVEYALLVGLIAIVVIGVLIILGPAIAAKFTEITTELKTVR